MAQIIDLGSVSLNWINIGYSGATQYEVNDALYHEGSSYRCIQQSIGQEPSISPAYWAIIALGGDVDIEVLSVASGNVTFTVADHFGKYVIVDPTGTGQSVTMPSIGAGNVNSFVTIYNPTTYDMSITPGGINALEGVTTIIAGKEVHVIVKDSNTLLALAQTTVPMIGATDSADGKAGEVPKPVTGDESKVLVGNGSWDYTTKVETLTYTSSPTPGAGEFTHSLTQGTSTGNVFIEPIKVVKTRIGETEAFVMVFITLSYYGQDDLVNITLAPGTLTTVLIDKLRALRPTLNVSAYVIAGFTSADILYANRDNNITGDSPCYIIMEGTGTY